ncbi:MAG: DUF1292 domain-containing protein [Bacilli bacterium]|nr:DUF1292 domain-containing protein [Bacilli bacterium]
MNSSEKLRIIDANGNVKEYNVLYAFYWIKTDKNYVIYTDNTYDENNDLNVFASIYYPDDNTKFDNIETEEEWEKIENILKSILDSDGEINERRYN